MVRRFLLLLALACAASQWLAGASLAVPDHVPAGQELSIPTSGSGEATLYLFGPSHVAKRTVKLGAPVILAGDELVSAGRYVVVLNGESSTFFVTAGPVVDRGLHRPSFAGSGVNQGCRERNRFSLRSQSEPGAVASAGKLQLAVPGAPDVQRTETSKGGVAWTRLDSSRRAGAAQFVASAGAASVRRVVQEVASEPCNIRMHAGARKTAPSRSRPTRFATARETRFRTGRS